MTQKYKESFLGFSSSFHEPGIYETQKKRISNCVRMDTMAYIRRIRKRHTCCQPNSGGRSFFAPRISTCCVHALFYFSIEWSSWRSCGSLSFYLLQQAKFRQSGDPHLWQISIHQTFQRVDYPHVLRSSPADNIVQQEPCQSVAGRKKYCRTKS